jgi:dipeptidyl aminopeptidase/acylaminoacyl peptidase
VERLLPSGVTWSSQAIVVSLGVSGVVVIPTDGSPARVASITRAGTVCRCAQRAVLSPDGRHLFMAGPNLYVVPVEGGELRDLGVPGDAVVAVREDLVIYVSAEGALMAARLDAKRMTLSTPVSLRERVTPGSLPALSASGTLLMFTGLATTRLELVDDRGQGTPVADPGNGTLGAMFPRFSPDGRRIALSVMDRRVDALTSIPNTITVVDVAAGTATRLTNDLLADRPEWTPDGKRLIYRRIDSGREELWWQPFDRSQPAERLQPMRGIDRIAEGVLSPDSRWLLFRTLSLSTGRDIWYRALAGDTTPRPFEVTPYDEAMPRFSPDGRWVAYTSNDGGRTEVFVRPFPGPGGRTQISADGGTDPVWAPDGRRLFYLNGTELTAATLGTEQDLRVLSRDKLFAADVTAGGIHANFDVARDGRHFLMLRSSGSGVDLAVTLNWLATAVQGVAR